MIQNALEDNNMDKASGLKEKRCNGECWPLAEGEMQSKKIYKNPSNSRNNWKFLKPNSQGFLVDDTWWVWHGAANKAVKQDLKNSKDLNNICSEEVLGKDTNLFAKM